ncbi:hypothetical protein R3P38DRAFT_3179739 [Favolaschia claudopus]|uniref:Uncharacterized protein n=1 Tax=Favolaschia claudopus TaxID=2862362 RepID=A0AAW0CQZ7_9AGAR
MACLLISPSRELRPIQENLLRKWRGLKWLDICPLARSGCPDFPLGLGLTLGSSSSSASAPEMAARKASSASAPEPAARKPTSSGDSTAAPPPFQSFAEALNSRAARQQESDSSTSKKEKQQAELKAHIFQFAFDPSKQRFIRPLDVRYTVPRWTFCIIDFFQRVYTLVMNWMPRLPYVELAGFVSVINTFVVPIYDGVLRFRAATPRIAYDPEPFAKLREDPRQPTMMPAGRILDVGTSYPDP